MKRFSATVIHLVLLVSLLSVGCVQTRNIFVPQYDPDGSGQIIGADIVPVEQDYKFLSPLELLFGWELPDPAGDVMAFARANATIMEAKAKLAAVEGQNRLDQALGSLVTDTGATIKDQRTGPEKTAAVAKVLHGAASMTAANAGSDKISIRDESGYQVYYRKGLCQRYPRISKCRR